jgi:hypothetical protein
MGYTDIPSWVSKDYESAWENALSYDFDVINHDGEMYVFSSNYGIGGVVIGGLVGAYIGYKVAENKKAKSQIRKAKGKVKRLGKKIKSKFDEGGQVQISEEELNKIRQVIAEEQAKNKGFVGRIQDNIAQSQVSPKEAMQFVKDNPEVLKLLKFLEKGGKVDSENYEMLRGKIKELMHHAEELKTITNRKKEVPAWVLAKSTRASTDLSDITHYMDGNKFAMGGGVDYKEQQINDLNSWDNDEIANFLGVSISQVAKDRQRYIREAQSVMMLDSYGEGGGIGFKGLANKVAKRYEGKSVAPKYQGEYGKRYSKSEAQEVGRKVAGKVYWQQQGRKFTKGGGVDEVKNNNNKYDVAILFDTNNDKYKIENEKIIDLLNQYSVVINKKYDALYIKLNYSKNYKELLKELSKIENNYQSVLDVAVFTEKYDGGRAINKKDYFDNGGGVGEDVSWDVTFHDKDNGETFDVNVLGWFENEEDAIKQAISENNVYVDENDYGRMYWGQNEVTIYGAKKNYNVGGGVDYGKGGKTPIQYKGYTINFIQGEYRADAYANPQITDKNLAKLKQKINQYLKGNSKYDNGGNITDYDWANEFRKTKKYFVVLLAEENGEEEIFEGNVQARSESEALSEARRGFEFNYPNKMIKKVSIDKTKDTNRYEQGGNVSGLNDLIYG